MEDINSLISELTKPIQEEEIKPLQEEYISYINDYIKNCNKKTFSEIDTKERIVIISDIHNDANSLSQIFIKLNISKEYDYFNKAIFVFLGDYLDRGGHSLQVLRFILKFKCLLGNRCILLKGNHDNILYSTEKGYYAVHSPHDTLDFFKGLFEEKLLLKLKEFYGLLPYFAFTKIKRQKYLFVHASIPKDKDLKRIDLKLLEDIILPLSDNHEYRQLFTDMTWGDVSEVEFKNQDTVSSIRYEFGSKQFEKFMKDNDFDFMFRGHEAITDGYKKFYDGKLISLFSSGGFYNEVTGYNYIKTPSFGIIREDGEILIENIYLYKFNINIKDSIDTITKHSILLKSDNLDAYVYIQTDLNSLVNDKNVLSEDETKKLFKSNEEFSIDLEISKNAIGLINSEFNNYLLNYIKQKQLWA
jgi:hypothetical protein